MPDDNIIDMRDFTPEDHERVKENLLKSSYLCPKCKSLHLTSEDVAGRVCCSSPGKFYCEGILYKVKDLDEIYEN